MSKPDTPQLIRPNGGRLAVIGAVSAAGALLWIAAGVLAYLAESIDVPRALFTLSGYAAIAITLSAVILGTTYLTQRAAADNHAIILAAVARVAHEQERLSVKIDKVNPWEIYSAAAADILGDRKGRTS